MGKGAGRKGCPEKSRAVCTLKARRADAQGEDSSPRVREQTPDVPGIWRSGIYTLNIVYVFVASLVRKLQDSVLIKFKAGLINHIPQGMGLPLGIPQHGAHQTLQMGRRASGCLRLLCCSGHFFTLASLTSSSVIQQVSPRRETQTLK